VYAGLIRIEKGAARSDAYQANRNLVLSDHAKATSIPMLEIDNNDVRCTHEEFNLSDGELWGMDVECPQHGSRFNLVTGKVTGLPAVIPAKTYPVSVEGDEVYIEVPD